MWTKTMVRGLGPTFEIYATRVIDVDFIDLQVESVADQE